LKIADFGIISFLDEGPVNDNNGSSAYFAPEVHEIYHQMVAKQPPNNFDPERAMIWSLGVVLFYLLTSNLPFDSNRYDVQHEVIKYKQ
jgi:serine/threonine protein kinase